MKFILLTLTWLISGGASPAEDAIKNRLINYSAFQEIVDSSGKERESRRLSENDFLAMMNKEGVVLLDARSSSKFQLRHIKGALNLPFTDFTESSLAGVLAKKDTQILIYCNNNFLGSPSAFASKAPAASLNLATFTSLRAYGYRNIFELGPLLDVDKTKIPFEGSEVK